MKGNIRHEMKGERKEEKGMEERERERRGEE